MVYSVIGANFGDEGKGFIVNNLSRELIFKNINLIVVRTNGGSQAGHTVEDKGLKHVFHHFGSGTFQFVDTYLSKEFIVNPIMFKEEFMELNKFIFSYSKLREIVHPDARVTTPYDMIVNQALESIRDNNRHGSCGLGINETIVRNKNKHFELKVKDLSDIKYVKYLLNQIKQNYIPKRLKDLDIYDRLDDRNSYYLIDEDNFIQNKFIEDCEFFIKSIDIRDYQYLTPYLDKGNLIFENAQGLLLDKNSVFYPHVTPTKTGLTYPIGILKELNYKGEIKSIYVTRPYITRHGAGYLPNECKQTDLYQNIKDETNIPNEWQGSLRFAIPDIDKIAENLLKDIIENKSNNILINSYLAVTCKNHLNTSEEVKTVQGVMNLYEFMGKIIDETAGLLIPYGIF